MQGPGEQDSQERALESPTNMSKVSDSTYVLGMDEVDSNRNEMSLSNDTSNIGIETQVSVDSSSMRSPVDSMFGDDRRHLLGGNHSAGPVIVGNNWGGRAGNLSSKSSSSTRRYSFQYCKFVARRRVLPYK
jgi:tRNA threonylcarbamoyladenosine modification (KEOPS) complex  Pcc1 subunit